MSRISSLVSRRTFLSASSVLLTPALARAEVIHADFPAHEPELVQEMVGVSHANIARVKELVGRQPALAKVAFDWGFGDWESCIDAASHVGNREIAEFLIANGARPTIFTAAMLGQLDVVKALITAAPGIQRAKGPHSITLLRHAMAGGPRAQSVVDYLKSIEGADDRPSEKPLTPEDVKKLSGAYSFGYSFYGRIDVTADAKGQLSFGRPGKFPRGLTHLGSYEFVPAGSEHVRIRFSEAAAGMTLTVHDPDVVVTAKKTASS
jgi:hypothetical protein